MEQNIKKIKSDSEPCSHQQAESTKSKTPKATKNILLGCTGSVAAIKMPLLVEKILQYNENNENIKLEVYVIVTDHAQHFFNVDELPSETEVYRDAEEWSYWNKRGDPVLHIDLGKWADVMCIAPLDANTLAKMAQGLCDNLLTCTTRAWDFKKPLLFCPAMNTRMWNHPITSTHVRTLKQWGCNEVSCVTKTLVCGDTGIGAMAEVDTIVKAILDKLNL